MKSYPVVKLFSGNSKFLNFWIFRATFHSRKSWWYYECHRTPYVVLILGQFQTFHLSIRHPIVCMEGHNVSCWPRTSASCYLAILHKIRYRKWIGTHSLATFNVNSFGKYNLMFNFGSELMARTTESVLNKGGALKDYGITLIWLKFCDTYRMISKLASWIQGKSCRRG